MYDVSEEPMVTESTRQATQPTQTRPTNSAQGKEFDPLSSQKVTEEKVMSSFGISSQSGIYTVHPYVISIINIQCQCLNYVERQKSMIFF